MAAPIRTAAGRLLKRTGSHTTKEIADVLTNIEDKVNRDYEEKEDFQVQRGCRIEVDIRSDENPQNRDH